MLYNVKEVSKCLGINIHLVYLSVYGPAGTMSGESLNLVSFSCCKALAKAGAFCFARKNILMQRRVGYMFIELS